jgi:hypothetical protein
MLYKRDLYISIIDGISSIVIVIRSSPGYCHCYRENWEQGRRVDGVGRRSWHDART